MTIGCSKYQLHSQTLELYAGAVVTCGAAVLFPCVNSIETKYTYKYIYHKTTTTEEMFNAMVCVYVVFN